VLPEDPLELLDELAPAPELLLLGVLKLEELDLVEPPFENDELELLPEVEIREPVLTPEDLL
jgi:hypothetical protein